MISWNKAHEVAEYADLTAVLLIPIAPAAYFMAVVLGITTVFHLVQLVATIRQGASHA